MGRKQKKTEEKEVLSALVAACTTYLPAHASKNKIREMLGFHTKSFYNFMKRPVNNSTTYQHISRKGRKGTDLQKQQRDCVNKFCHSDEASIFDSNSRKIIEVEKEGRLEKHFGRVWNVPTVREQYNLFLQSDTLEEYSTLHPNFKTPSMTYFFKLRCPCVSRQSLQSCVDIKISSMQQYMRAINKYIRCNKTIREELTVVDRNWTDLLGGFVEDFVSAAQCAAHIHKSLTIGVGSTKKTPAFVKWECAEGK